MDARYSPLAFTGLFPVNVNTASDEELAAVPGIGEKSVTVIKQKRGIKKITSLKELDKVVLDKSLPFLSVDDLDLIGGMAGLDLSKS